eukprot:TRINITY_DN33822_c0_g1_i1.p1 TRINITY_DN33822_c0_g1~~TRINITY_DN33822_c0_g1_i1.p1  ORF type:complete len:186 (+),score=34.41 TRINITY_DN33822_c0_g1_i1:46-603(+)
MLPRCLVFDLDGCVWDPEMYELWGGGGAPFKENKDGTLSDRAGTRVHLLGDVKKIMNEFVTDEKWKESKICVASSCDEPSWARECISKFDIGDGLKLKDVFDTDNIEIYKGSKDRHLKAIAKQTGFKLEEMIFFDNQTNNCHTVAGIGVTVVYTPDGVTRSAFEEGLEKFPSPGEIIGPKSRGYW